MQSQQSDLQHLSGTRIPTTLISSDRTKKPHTEELPWGKMSLFLYNEEHVTY